MQIPVISGIYTNAVSDFRTSYPRNLVPVPKSNGISEGYLRPAEGIVQFGIGPGKDRGGINWNNGCYRVMGSKLILIEDDGTYSVLGDVGGSTQYCSFDYSFDQLAINSAGNLFYWDGTNLTQVADPDLGTVDDVLWVDGYFLTTDGEFIVQTELNDPLSVNPLKYGSSEIDPDPILCLLKLRNEPHALNRYTIEAFQNIGGTGFAFQRIEGAQIQRGCVGTHAACIFADAIAFVGSGRNEAVGVWVGANGSSVRISTREIEQTLAEYTETALSKIVVEARLFSGHNFLYIHLPDQTLVYDAAASEVVGVPVWHILTTSMIGTGQYLARGFVYCYGKWISGNPQTAQYGYMTNSVSSHYGERNGWDFGVNLIYNEGRGAIFHEMELVCLSGRSPLGEDPYIYTAHSNDGITWSGERRTPAGKAGAYQQRIVWFREGAMSHWRTQYFRGSSDAHLSIARLEAKIEGLNV